MEERFNRRYRRKFTAPLLRVCALFAIIALAASAQAQNITGTIQIKAKLTKRRVTPSVSIYQRGEAVDLGKDPAQDPLEFEQSRVVVYLEGPGPADSAPSNPAKFKIEQLNRRFAPDLLVVPVGSTVSFPNMDPIFHNLFSLSKPKSFDLGSYDQGESRDVFFPKPGIVEIYCHLHPNMAATIVVTPNRWYAKPDRTGQYQIPDVPPGKYTVVAWHKSAGFFRKEIVVESGHDSKVDFFIPINAPEEAGPAIADSSSTAGGK
jgi:plastocyanin